jgi:thymidylate kinase
MSFEFYKKKLIAVVGPDKVGKFTQTHLLRNNIKSFGHNVTLVEMPFNDHMTYDLIYAMLKNGTAKTFPNLFQFVQFMNKFLFQKLELPQLLKENDFIIFDRWKQCAVVYGDAGGANPIFNRWLANFLIDADYTVVLEGKSFSRKEETDDVYEKDNSLQSKVAKGYNAWSKLHASVSSTVDCVGTKEEVHARIKDALKRAGVWTGYYKT